MHDNFPNRINVQFLSVLDRRNIRIEIWERGAGYTLASGSSSSASAAVARRLGLVDANLTVHMPGGQIGIEISPDFAIRMTGPVTRVAEGTLHPDIFQTKVGGFVASGSCRPAGPPLSPGWRVADVVLAWRCMVCSRRYEYRKRHGLFRPHQA